MITKIGIVSGQILELLESKKQPVNITDIKLNIDEPMDLINMAIGWLIREQHVRMITKGNENYVSLFPTEVVSLAKPDDDMCALKT